MTNCPGYERNPGSIGCKHCQKLKKEHKPAAKPAIRPIVVNVVKPFVGKPFDASAIAEHHAAVVAAPWLIGMATPEPAAAPSPSMRVLCVLDGVEAKHKVLDHFDDEAARLGDQAADADADGRSTEANLLYDQADIAKRQRAVAEMELRARLDFAGAAVDVADKDEPIDDVHGEVKVGGQWVKVADYDLVFLDNETASVRCLAAVAGLPPSCVAFVANVKAERQTGEGQRRRQVIPATLTAVLRRVGDLVADRRRQLTMPWGAEIAYPPAPTADDAAVDEAIVRFAQA